jgi:hypothetical protein
VGLDAFALLGALKLPLAEAYALVFAIIIILSIPPLAIRSELRRRDIVNTERGQGGLDISWSSKCHASTSNLLVYVSVSE